jgi:hypothetical protein
VSVLKPKKKAKSLDPTSRYKKALTAAVCDLLWSQPYIGANQSLIVDVTVNQQYTDLKKGKLMLQIEASCYVKMSKDVEPRRITNPIKLAKKPGEGNLYPLDYPRKAKDDPGARYRIEFLGPATPEFKKHYGRDKMVTHAEIFTGTRAGAEIRAGFVTALRPRLRGD